MALLEAIFSSSCVWEKVYLLFITMAFITNVDELQDLLDACSQTLEWELLIQSILIPAE